jgi:adenylate kinase family enzyme
MAGGARPPLRFKRAVVIGSSGAGKTTFARELGSITGLPVIHIDQLFWEPGWVEAPTAVFRQRLDRVLEQPAWIIDGVNTSTLQRRLELADVMFWLDRSRYLCLWQLARRVAGSYGQVRPDLAPGCPEQLPNLHFLKFIWNFDKTYRHRIDAAIDAAEMRAHTVMLSNHRESAACLKSIAAGWRG